MAERKYSYQTGEKHTFTTIDYVLFGATLSISAGIGIFHAIKDRKKQNTKDFLLAGGNMSAIPVALSLLASFMSAITLLGTPAEMYTYGTMYWWIGLSYLFVVFLAAHIYVPVFYRLGITSVMEYLEMRFGKIVRTSGSVIFSIQMLLYMAIVLYAPSLALNAVTGFSLWGSVISVGIVCTLYTAIGGMKAVLWTDSFQVFMMFVGLLAILIQGSIEVGGFARAWEISAENERIYFTDFSPDPATRHSVWSLVVGGTFTWVAIYGANQAQVQRALTCPSLKKAKIALWLNFPGLCCVLYLCCLNGIILFAFYKSCDPLQFGLVGASDQLLPLLVMDVLGHVRGVPGLFVACLFSGALSTISSGLNSMGAVFLQDIVKPYISPNISERNAKIVSQVTAGVLGPVCIGLSYLASLLGGVLQAALSLFGMMGGPVLGVFTLGMLFPWANKWGALAGLYSSLIFLFWIGIGAQVVKPPQPHPPVYTYGCNWSLTPAPTYETDTYGNIVTTLPTINETLVEEERGPVYALYTLSYMWYSATAVLTCVVVGLLVSWATGFQKAKDVNPKLISPFFDIVFPWLPEKIRKPLRFGLNHDYILDDGVKEEYPKKQDGDQGEVGLAEDSNADARIHEKRKEAEQSGKKSRRCVVSSKV